MACCGKSSGCSCILTPGQGVSVVGTGTATDPYIISSTVTDLSSFLGVQDTESVNLILTGSGVLGDPFILRANATIKATDLADVNDPSGGPSVGESFIWVGTGSAGHWEFGALPPSPAGATNVSPGLTGVGSVGDPIKVSTSGVWGSGDLAPALVGADSTAGLEVYLDSANKLRAQPVNWADVGNKPTTFAPSAHTHTVSQITDLATNGDVAKIGGKRITVAMASTPLPSSPAPVAGDLFFFPRGS